MDTQLRSHQLFSENFAHYASLVDAATLYHTGTCAFWQMLMGFVLMVSNTLMLWCLSGVYMDDSYRASLDDAQ